MGQQRPNVVFIYAGDLGYGDASAYGTTKISTLNMDRLAKEGIRFTAGCAASAMPSRYSLLTAEYAWRKEGKQIAPGDASPIIDRPASWPL